MERLDAIARVVRQDGEGGLAIIQNANEERTQVIAQGKYRFDVCYHPTSFNNREEIIEFVKEYNDTIDIELIGEDGKIEIEFDDSLI